MATDSKSSAAAAVDAGVAPEDALYVDNSNLTELKATCDDAVERILTRPSADGSEGAFRASHLHTDVRLVLGFTASLSMIACAAWSYLIETDWEVNKWPTALVVGAYVVLSGAQMLSSYLQGDTIFLGTRARSASKGKGKAAETGTETLRISSAPQLPKALFLKADSAEARTQRLLPGTSLAGTSTERPVCVPPVYALSFSYTSAGASSKTEAAAAPVPLGHLGEWFTQDGEFREDIFEQRLRKAVAQVMH